MRRTEALQEVRQMRFEEINARFRCGRLSSAEAAEWLGCSERTFRRLRVRYEAEGAAGLLDRRLGKASPHRIAADEAERIAALYEQRYTGWTVKHFHERAQARHGLAASYGWTKGVLHARGLVRPAPKRSAHRKKRPRKPVPGMMLHQDGSRHLWVPALGRQVDLIATLDDATGELYSAFLVEEEGTASTFQALHAVIAAKGLCLVCQPALKRDPLSASKRDPSRWWRTRSACRSFRWCQTTSGWTGKVASPENVNRPGFVGGSNS